MSKNGRSVPIGCPQLAFLLMVFLSSSSSITAVRLLAARAAETENGTSYYTKERYPKIISLPYDPSITTGFTLVAESNTHMYGRDVITNRIALEVAVCEVINNLLVPELKIRMRNYTSYPSQTPGLENYTSVVEVIQEYAYLNRPEVWGGPLNFEPLISAQEIQLLNLVVDDALLQKGLNANIFMKSFEVNVPWKLIMPETPDITSILSRIELTGNNLLPFHYDKQALFLETICRLFRAENVPVATLNISNSWIAETPVSSRRRIQGTGETVFLDVWTNVVPAGALTPQAVWSKIALPDSRVWEMTQQWGVPMNITFRNATSYVLTAEGTRNITVTPEVFATSTSASSGGLGPGVIAGIVCSVVLALAVGLRAQLVWRRRLWESKASLPEYRIEDEISPDEIVICKRSDGSDWLLGESKICQVYKGMRRGVTVVVVKKFNFTLDTGTQKVLRREIRILRNVNHDGNIVQFFGACLSGNGMLCMEYMEGGDLRTALSDEQRLGMHVFDWENKGARVALDVAQGLYYLHTNEVVHRNLKSSNVLLTKEGLKAKVDGVAMIEGRLPSSSPECNLAYAAPELKGLKCTSRADVFSYGVLLWELVTKERPQPGQMRDLRVPEECPPEVATLIMNCMSTDPEARPTMKGVVERLQSIIPADSDTSECSA